MPVSNSHPLHPRVSRPVTVAMPAHGVVFAESVHEADFRMEPRADPFHKIIYLLQGSVVYEELGAEGKASITGSAGSFFAIPSRVRHRLHDLLPSTLLLLGLSPAFLTQTRERTRLWQQIVRAQGGNIRFDQALCRNFESLWRRSLVEQAHLQIGNSEIVCAHATQILVALARLPADDLPDQTRRRVESLVREMEGTFYDDWNIDAASTRAGLSRRHFCQVFKEMTGMTFLEKLTEYRLQHAASLLAQGGHSIAGAAFSSGCQDLSHFYRLFRRRFGMPPGQWLGHLPRPTQASGTKGRWKRPRY